MKVIVDAMGGDNAPDAIVRGSVDAINANKNLQVVLCGKIEKIQAVLNGLSFKKSQLEIVDARDIISNDDMPTVAIKQKSDSSLAIAFDILKKDEEAIGLVSAGSTGAILAGGFLKIGRIKGVSRPALAPFLPTQKNGNVLIVDCGANADCKPINLCHFAVMGSEYYKEMFGVEKPRVALLSVGTEDHKGNELCHQTFPLLKQLDINFVGNMEARDLMSGDYDVVVCDGFAGNVLLKATEGSLKLVMAEIKKSAKSRFLSFIGAFLMKGAFKDLKNKLDFDVYGGAPFLGCRKLIIKSHGSSKEKSIQSSIEGIVTLYNKNLNEHIEEALSKIEIQE